MPSSYTPQQKAQISQFVGFTSTKESVAAKLATLGGSPAPWLWIASGKTKMLTAEEQWKIIQEEERRTGRGRRKKKTFMEQLKDMGGFGHDPDGEQAIREDLERVDTRHKLQRSKESFSNCEVSFGESSFWESRKRLFHSWMFQAKRPNSWIEEKDLPLFFRFALHRPIMDELSFQRTLQALNLELEMPMGDVRQPHTRPLGRSRQLMFGIDVDQDKNVHVSSRFRHMLPRGGAENMDKVGEEAARMVQQDDEDMQQLVGRQLWTVFEHVQNGSVPLKTAPWHYRDALNTQDMSDENLIVCLQQFGIPTDHILVNEQSPRAESAHSHFLEGLGLSSEEIKKNAAPDEKEVRIIEELVNYIRLFRGGTLQEFEVIPMIQHCLKGLELEASVISDILTDLEKDDEIAALLMWEDACADDSSSVSSGPLIMSSSSSSSSSEEDGEWSHEEEQKSLRAVRVPDPQGNAGGVDDAAKATQSHDGSATKDMDHPDDGKENEPELSEATSIDQSSMSPSGDRPTNSHVNEVERRVQPPGTPRLKPKSPTSPAPAVEIVDSQAIVESDRETPGVRANVGRRRASSPEDGMTTGIWGLLMPTKEARKLAHKLKLPQDTIDAQVRSISRRRTRRRRASFAKTIVTFPKFKRKASMALHEATSPKSPKRGDHSDLFAREGEDQQTFVLSHFDRAAIGSEDMCVECLRLPCVCEYGPTLRSSSEPECPKCLQQPCMCDRLIEPEEATPIMPPGGKPLLDAKLADRTRPEPPKQSVSLLAYLARALDNDDVLGSIKQLERLSTAETTIADAKAMLDHIQQGILAGEEIDATENDDREAVRILNNLVESSRTLTDYSHKLHCEAKKEDSSTARIKDCRDQVSEGPERESSLLNGSAGREYLPAPPSNPSASAAASTKTQTDIANGPVFQANNTPLAGGISPYLPTTAPDSSVPRLESSSDIKDAVQLSRFQADTGPDSSAAGESSRAATLSQSPARRPPSSTADLSQQVSHHSVDVEGDMDCDTFGAPLTRQRDSSPMDTGNSDDVTQGPPSPKPGAKQLSTSILPPLSRSPSDEDLARGRPRLRSRKSPKKINTTAQSCLKSSDFDSLPLWPAQSGLPEKAGKEWMSLTPKEALERAKQEAFSQHKSLAFYMEERRTVRTRIKKENDLANSKLSDHRFFQSTNGSSGSSGNSVTSALNKLFDKYRDNAAEEPDKIGIEGSMRYLTDLGVKLDEVVVLAILTELGAPTMGEFTRDGFVCGWQSHRAETLNKQQGQIASFRRSLAMTPDFFKRVYKQTFLIARLPGQKIVPLETALEYWRLLFTAPSLSWNTANTPWLTLWLDYLESQWKKSVSKDMWDQTGVFAMKSLEDERMSWWSEDGAWPGVLDEFVFYVREKKGNGIGSEMDVG